MSYGYRCNDCGLVYNRDDKDAVVTIEHVHICDGCGKAEDSGQLYAPAGWYTVDRNDAPGEPEDCYRSAARHYCSATCLRDAIIE